MRSMLVSRVISGPEGPLLPQQMGTAAEMLALLYQLWLQVAAACFRHHWHQARMSNPAVCATRAAAPSASHPFVQSAPPGSAQRAAHTARSVSNSGTPGPCSHPPELSVLTGQGAAHGRLGGVQGLARRAIVNGRRTFLRSGL